MRVYILFSFMLLLAGISSCADKHPSAGPAQAVINALTAEGESLENIFKSGNPASAAFQPGSTIHVNNVTGISGTQSTLSEPVTLSEPAALSDQATPSEPVGFSELATSSERAALSEPVGLLLTWQQDPTTTMTIDWHSGAAAAEGSPYLMSPVEDWNVLYKAEGETGWKSKTSRSHPFPFSDRLVHRVELTGLEPSTVYKFRVGDYTRTYSFRTMPADASDPIRFAVGGDTRHQLDWFEKTNRQVVKYDPDFILWGGDISYADGLAKNIYRWYEVFEGIMNTLITDDGRAIPILITSGNHEIRGRYFRNVQPQDLHHPMDDEFRERMAPYFFSLFAMPGHPGYNVLDFGEYMSILLLDTDHTARIDGPQTNWLRTTLAEREMVPHVFPVYHIPAWPSVRSFNEHRSGRVRKHWVPLFEEYNVRVAFENHDHAYKRTYPIRNGQIDENGVVYIGDGAWGVEVREPGLHQDGEDIWYINRAEPLRHFILATIHNDQQHFIMVDEDGNVFDEYSPQTP